MMHSERKEKKPIMVLDDSIENDNNDLLNQSHIETKKPNCETDNN